ncbi:TPA: hypothetical protein ACNU5N_005270, partial [Citrobacter farmeri]
MISLSPPTICNSAAASITDSLFSRAMTVSSDFQIDTLSLIGIYSNSINDRELTQDLKNE